MVFASAAYLSGVSLMDKPACLSAWVVCMFAALLPDIDLPTSHIGRCCATIATAIEQQFHHRTITHSLCAVLLLMLACWPVAYFNSDLYIALIGGYASHLLIDLFNPRGIDLCWPSPEAWVISPSQRDKLPAVGSSTERMICLTLLLTHVLLLPISHWGLRSSLHHLLRDFSLAVEAYTESPRDHWYYLELEATDTLEHEQIRCKCLIIARWHEGLLIEYQNTLYTLGTGAAHYQWFPHQALLIRGEKLTIGRMTVQLHEQSLDWLYQYSVNIPYPVYLSGTITLDDDRYLNETAAEIYRPVRHHAHQLGLEHAKPKDLLAWREDVALAGDVRIEVWLSPQQQWLAPEILDQAEKNRLPVTVTRIRADASALLKRANSHNYSPKGNKH